MTELDPVSGRQIEDNWWEDDDPTYHYLARGPDSLEDPGEYEWIEAAYITKHNGFYYLFVNWYSFYKECLKYSTFDQVWLL